MRRYSLIIQLSVVIVAFLVWNALFPGAQMELQDNGTTAPTPASPLHLSWIILIMCLAIVYFLNWIQIVDQRYRRPVMRFGSYARTLNSGISFLEPFSHSTLRDISIQDQVREISANKVQTMDNVGISLNGVLTYRIQSDHIEDAVLRIGDVQEGVTKRALSTLTDVGAGKDLDHLLGNRADFCSSIKEELAARVKDWGVEVLAFELRDLKINDDKVAEAIAMKARAKKEGEAEIERAQLQAQVAEALNKAADTYTDHGRWLKGMETLLEMTRSAQNNTILVPTDVITSIATVAPALIGK